MLKIGTLAKRTGLTVRTLHHYDEIGLLRPTHRSAAGYRLYDDADVVRLQRIVALRQLGVPLADIGRCLEDPGYTLPRVLRLRADGLRREIEAQRRLCVQLEALADRLDAAEPVSVDEHLETIGAMTMFEKYYTPEQMEQLAKRREEVGDARIREVEQEWPKLIAEVRAAMEAGKDPASPEVVALARRWKGLVEEFTGGDPGVTQSLANLYRGESAARERAGIDPGLFDYVRRASEGT